MAVSRVKVIKVTYRMDIYLVGGAVRDQLMNIPVVERDWVVVGGTPEALRDKGYAQVGKDFPVFLHPQTKEEYALARTERKKGRGYYGFSCNYNEKVTLEEDLARRDLTINAMAMDSEGNLIDPFHGQKDIAQKLLRHVSPAFMEDPVRVLRIARFAARYFSLGFRIADETWQLMYSMVRDGELDYLVPERVWQEWSKSLKTDNPEVFIEVLRHCGALEILFPEIHRLFGVPNSKHYHPEVDSGIHSLMVLQEAVKLTDESMLRFAALVHDLGKGVTPMQIWPSHHGHEMRGVPIITKLCERLRVPSAFRELAVSVSKLHIKVHQVFQLRSETIVKVLEEADAFRRPEIFQQILLVCEADSAGKGKEKTHYVQGDIWRNVLQECSKINPQDVIKEGFSGVEIKNQLRKLRVECVRVLKTKYPEMINEK